MCRNADIIWKTVVKQQQKGPFLGGEDFRLLQCGRVMLHSADVRRLFAAISTNTRRKRFVVEN